MLGPIRRNRTYRRVRKRLRRRFRSRERFFRRAAAFAPYLGVDTGKAVYFVSTADRSIGRSLFVKAGVRKEHVQLERALRILTDAGAAGERRTIVDVGANIGTTIVSALLDQGFATGLAFEPADMNFRLLRANLAVNSLEERVRAYRLALSDRAGEALLHTSSANPGSGWLRRDGTEPAGCETVRTARLDDVLADGGVAPGDVGLLWIDVEGHEPYVLAGAPGLLERSVPLVLEFSPPQLERSDGLDLLLEQLAQAYTHVHDLLRPEDGPLSTSDLQPLLDRCAGSLTDLLVLREQ